MEEDEKTFFACDFVSVPAKSLTKYRKVLMGILGLPSTLDGFLKYWKHVTDHLKRDETEAMKDYFAQGSNKVEYNLFLKAQRAWSGKSRVMEAELMSWDCNLCSQCQNVSIGVSAEHDKCEYCRVIEIGKRKRKGHERYSNESDSEAGSADENIIPEDYVSMYSAENKAIPPARQPAYAALDLVEQAVLTPIIPYIRVTDDRHDSRGSCYGHQTASKQEVGRNKSGFINHPYSSLH